MTQILTLIITLLGTLITTFLIPYLKAKLTEKQQSIILTVIEIAVNAAEQIYKNNEKSGQEKMEFVKAFLEEQGINVNSKKTENMIESSVFKMSNGG